MRESRDRALVVCEGGKTEPQYLTDLVSSLGLGSADVRICGEECGSDPKSIYNFAIDMFSKDGDYDVVFCVFDRDKHSTFDWARTQILKTELPNQKKIYCIYSIPCFEYWIMLHFVHTDSPITEAGGKSAGQIAVSNAKRYIPKYRKAAVGVFQATKDRLPQAIKSSKIILQASIQSGSENPTTRMHELVEFLISMAKVQV
ncbi:RloB family protein [Acidisphaera sp. L21]|uniref:RloB family protein n=1 Tax=Acidisphaera sp. L21 TaxID=1641851 RepID=UPI00131AAA7E